MHTVIQPNPQMTLGKYLHWTRLDAAYYGEIGRNHAIAFWLQDREPKMSVLHDRLSAATNSRLRRELDSAETLIGIWFQTEIAVKGPKIFRPSLEQCLAMEQIAPRIAVADYAQPYPVMIVELPEVYRRARSCLADNRHLHGMRTPEFVLVGAPPGDLPSVTMQVMFSSNSLRTVVCDETKAPTIEDCILRNFGENSAMIDPATPSEREVIAGAMRLGVNAMLLLMQYGCKPLGPANPSHFQRVEHHLEVARRRNHRVRECELDLKLAPQLYGFAQDITLHEHDHDDAQTGTASEADCDLHRRPHWRRGHWKMHAHGPGRSLRKRILIKPVLVNGHLLRDGELAGLTLYRAR